MVNVGENRARNGVTDCPECETKENFKVWNFWTRRGTNEEVEDPSRERVIIVLAQNSVRLAAVGQNLSTAVKGAASAYDDRTKAEKETNKEGATEEGENKEDDEDEVLIINANGKGSGTKEPKGCDYKAFKGCNPPPFDGKKDAVATCHWVSAMEAVIDTSECREDQAVKFAAHSFTEEALHRWNTVKQSKTTADVEGLRWEDLKELVTKHFCPKNEIDKIEREFLTLKAGSVTH
ncbi:hypothetical protein R6Q59_002102 [Mikania micrantha]